MLTTGYWPTQAAIPMCVLPKTAKDAYDQFTRFYLSKHNGRKITLNPMLGSADLNAVFYGVKLSDELSQQEEPSTSSNSAVVKSERRHVLSVSTYQMCTLMLFNQRSTMTFEVSIVEYLCYANDVYHLFI